MEINQLNGLTLAYLGDAIYEKYIRFHIIEDGLTKVNALHKAAVKYTSGVSQAHAIDVLLKQEYLSEEEYKTYKRGKNSKSKSTRKNIDAKTYSKATGFEALIGKLYLDGNIARLEEIISVTIKICDGGDCFA